MRRYAIFMVALALVALVVTAAATFSGRSGTSREDRRISVTGDIVVAEGEKVDGPVITVDGDVRVRGTVTGYVAVADGAVFVSGRVTRGVVIAHGDAHISGHVGGDVVALSGRVIVTSDGSVSGDVVSRLKPRVARGTVDGDVKRVDLEGIFTGLIIGFLAYLWLATTISIALLGLLFVGLFPRGADASAVAGKRVLASFGWGALVAIVGPVVAVLVVASIIGIPLGIGLLGALNILAPLGYVTTALVIGRRWIKGTTNGARIGAFFAGFGILRLLALIPGIGLLVWFVACVYGVGALSRAAWDGGHRRPREELPPAPSEPPVIGSPAIAESPTVVGPVAAEGTPTTEGTATETPVTQAPAREDAPDEDPPHVTWTPSDHSPGDGAI